MPHSLKMTLPQLQLQLTPRNGFGGLFPQRPSLRIAWWLVSYMLWQPLQRYILLLYDAVLTIAASKSAVTLPLDCPDLAQA